MLEQNQFNMLQMVQFECLWVTQPLFSFICEDFSTPAASFLNKLLGLLTQQVYCAVFQISTTILGDDNIEQQNVDTQGCVV